MKDVVCCTFKEVGRLAQNTKMRKQASNQFSGSDLKLKTISNLRTLMSSNSQATSQIQRFPQCPYITLLLLRSLFYFSFYSLQNSYFFCWFFPWIFTFIRTLLFFILLSHTLIFTLYNLKRHTYLCDAYNGKSIR